MGAAHRPAGQPRRPRPPGPAPGPARSTAAAVPLVRGASPLLPTAAGVFRAYAYRSPTNGVEHIALAMGTVHGGGPVLVRVHSECLTGDLFGSRRCDCGEQLRSAMELIAARGRGVLIYLRGHEGRGIGLGQKLRAYELQDAGRDTVDANLELGFPPDARDYTDAAEILHDLRIDAVHLVTNNPDKESALRRHGVRVVTTVPTIVTPNPRNVCYLQTKRDRMGHHLPDYGEQGLPAR